MRIEGIAGSRQPEAVFLQAMLKSMRFAQHFIDDSNPFRSKIEGREISFAAMLSKPEGSALTAPKVLNDNQSFALSTPSKEKTASSDIDEFIRVAWPYAQQAASFLGLDPKILLAQAALETGWGRYVSKDVDGSSSNNLFNIKASSTADVEVLRVKTTEYIANNAIKISAAFKKYSSIENSFNDYVHLIKNNDRYASALANTVNPARYVDELQRAGYATDPHYATKILSIYHGDELQKALKRNGFVTPHLISSTPAPKGLGCSI